ncbi:MAG: oligosaccharide flippase family protein [Bacteroidota bacterium]
MIEKIQPFIDHFRNLRGSKLFKVFFWDVLSKGSDFLLLPVYLKIFSQAEYGFYTYALYIIVTASGIIKLGFDTAVSKMYFETNIYDRGRMLFSINSIWVVFFMLLFLTGMFTDIDTGIMTKVMGIPEADYHSIKLFLYLFILFNLVQTTLNVFFVIDDNAITYQKSNLIRIICGHLVVILLLIFVAKGDKAYFRLYIEPVLFLVSFIPLSIIFIKRMTFKFDWAAAKHGFAVGMPMVGTLIVAVIYNVSDKYFLQKTNGYNTLAVYNLAIFLTLPISLIFMSFNTVWLPQFFKEPSSAVNLKKSNRYVLYLSGVYVSLMVVLELCLFVALKLKLLSADYAIVLSFFPFIFIAKIAENLCQLYINFIVKWGRTMFNLITTVVFSAITLLLNFKIIPIYGLSGAVSVLFVVAAARLFVFYFYVKHRTKHVSVTIA